MARIVICQTIRHRRKSHSLLIFDVGIAKTIFACCKITFSTWISTRCHRYPRSGRSLIIRGPNGFFKDALNCTQSELFRHEYAVFFDPHNFRCINICRSTHLRLQILTFVETTLRDAKICPSNLYETRVNKREHSSLRFL